MPYITKRERKILDPYIDKLWLNCKQKRGRINYCCSRLVHLWCIEQMKKIKSLTKKYDIVNDAHGILNCVADEFYNAVVVPYENIKRKLNGPVSQLDEFADGRKEFLYKCKNGHQFNQALYSGTACPKCGTTNYREIK